MYLSSVNCCTVLQIVQLSLTEFYLSPSVVYINTFYFQHLDLENKLQFFHYMA